MKRLVGRFVAVPVRALAELLGIVGVFDTLALRRACWKLTQGVEDGKNLIVLMCRKHGVKHVRAVAEEILTETKDSEIAATIGVLEYSFGHDVRRANGWLRMAKENGYGNQELLLYLKLLLTNFFEDYNGEEVIEEILSRNDLPASATLTALVWKAHRFLEEERWKEAEQVAERILGVQEQVDARIVKWVVCMKRGDKAQADKHFDRGTGKLPEGMFNYVVAGGWLYLGEVGKAMEWLYKSDYEMFFIKDSVCPLGELARSEEFREYCRTRGNG
jgi:hypothetical protein